MLFLQGIRTMSYVKGKDKNQILEELKDTAEVGSLVYEQQKAALILGAQKILKRL
jgi:hypothetical protein